MGNGRGNKKLLAQRFGEWQKLRDPLMTYGNHHPSDRVRELAKEVERAVILDLNRTAVLLETRGTATIMDVFKGSEHAHAEALIQAERLMDSIRTY